MKTCSQCRTSYPDSMVFCPTDGTPLPRSTSPPSVPESTVPLPVPGALTQPIDGQAKRGRFTGLVLDGKYRMGEVVGNGAMGAVYHAKHLHMGTHVAVKVLSGSSSDDHQTIERFRREARAAAKINHPNAVRVMDFGVTPEGFVYLVMEYLEGRTLAQLISERGMLSAGEALRFIAPICAAVGKAHRKGIIHRDLKPDNVFITRDDDGAEIVKVVDFGIAKAIESSSFGTPPALTAAGTVVGTPFYLSPEQGMGEKVDARSDIYSLGVMLYELVTGKLPFVGSNLVGVVNSHIHEPPPSPRSINPAVSLLVETVILKALRKQPGDRYQTAEEFSGALMDAVRRNDPIANAQGDAVQPSRSRAVVQEKGARSGGLRTPASIPALWHSDRIKEDGGDSSSPMPWIAGAMVLLITTLLIVVLWLRS